MQTSNLNVNVAGLPLSQPQKITTAKEATMTSVFKQILQREGVFGLYRGIGANFIKVLPAVSTSYIVYEFASHKLGVNMT
jgi:hypothetical protein